MTNILEHKGNLKNRQIGMDIVLTHGDMDGLVSAFQIKTYLDHLNKMTELSGDIPRGYIILSDLKVNPEHTYKMLEIACKWAKITPSDLGEQDSIIILDRPTFRREDILSISNEIHYIAIDHHETSVELHETIASHFKENILLVNTSPEKCGATLTYDFINIEGGERFSAPFKELAYITNQWDTFLWTKSNDEDMKMKALSIQSCDKIFGPTLTWKYLNEAYKLNNHNIWSAFKDKAQIAYDIFFTQLEEVYRLVKYNLYNNVVRFEDNGRLYRCAILHGMEEYQSMLAQRIFEDFTSIDIVIYYNITGTISIRTRETSDVKANQLAIILSKFNGYSGGGHPNAAGGRIEDSDEFRDKLYHKVIEALKSAFKSVTEGVTHE